MKKKKTKKLNPNRKVTMTVREIEKMKKETTNTAIQITNYFPLWVLRTKFGFGKKRLIRYMTEYHDLLDSYNKDYVSLLDIAEQLEKEVNVEWEWEKINDEGIQEP